MPTYQHFDHQTDKQSGLSCKPANAEEQQRALIKLYKVWMTAERAPHSCCNGSPVRIVAPDPRGFVLHKFWMADAPS